MKNIFTALLIVVSLLMLNVRVGLCQEPTTSKEGETKAQTAQQQSETGQKQGTNPSQASTKPAKLDDKARKIKRVVEKVGVSGRITLYLKNGEDLFGNVVSYDDEGVQITEVDLKQVVTVQYRNIKKAREGYGAPEPFTGKRRSPTKGEKIGLLAGIVFAALLPIIIVASAKD